MRGAQFVQCIIFMFITGLVIVLAMSRCEGSGKSRSDAKAIQDRPGFYYVDVTHGAVTGKWYISQ